MDKTAKKILILANDGATLVLFRREVIQGILDAGYEVVVSLPRDESSAVLEQMGCRILDTPVHRRGMNPFQDLSLLLRYRRIVKEIQPDIILTYTIKPNVYGGWIASRFGIPYMTTITGLGTAVQNPGPLRWLTLFLYRRGVKRASAVFCQNMEIRDLLIRNRITAEDRIVMVPGSGVNLEQHRFEPYPEDDGTIRFVFIGRLMRDKGINEFAEAARRIKAKYKNVFFTVLGNYEEEYEGLLNALVARGVVDYPGFQRNVHPYITRSHAIIHPSYHEGMANVLLETAATGRPILASDIPGCRETFDEGVTGFGFPPKNADALYDTIEKFISLPYDQKKSFGLAGRQKMETEFDRGKVVNLYLISIGNKNNNTDK